MTKMFQWGNHKHIFKNYQYVLPQVKGNLISITLVIIIWTQLPFSNKFDLPKAQRKLKNEKKKTLYINGLRHNRVPCLPLRALTISSKNYGKVRKKSGSVRFRLISLLCYKYCVQLCSSKFTLNDLLNLEMHFQKSITLDFC